MNDKDLALKAAKVQRYRMPAWARFAVMAYSVLVQLSTIVVLAALAAFVMWGALTWVQFLKWSVLAVVYVTVITVSTMKHMAADGVLFDYLSLVCHKLQLPAAIAAKFGTPVEQDGN